MNYFVTSEGAHLTVCPSTKGMEVMPEFSGMTRIEIQTRAHPGHEHGANDNITTRSDDLCIKAFGLRANPSWGLIPVLFEYKQKSR